MKGILSLIFLYYLALVLFISEGHAEEITSANYIKYLPLSYAGLICQTDASRDFGLYGNNFLYTSDFENFTDLLTKIKEANDPQSMLLQCKFSEEFSQLLNEYNPPDVPPKMLKEALIDELNRLIQQCPLDPIQTDREEYKTEKTEELMRHNLSLLETAYSDEISAIKPYIDENRDGIDDDRYKILMKLCEKFSPILYRNSTMIPMDFRAFLQADKTPILHIDTWDISKSERKIVKRESIDFSFPEGNSKATNEDQLLIDLIREFHPMKLYSKRTEPENQLFKVMYFDLPGSGEGSWRKEFKNIISSELPREYKKYSRLYAHPFIYEGKTKDGEAGYEFVIQYWFFYPFNDGPNDHEGDWEHINVIITIKDKGALLLSREDIEKILGDDQDTNLGLVIKRVEYYFHHKVIIFDYMNPNVYENPSLPIKKWYKQVKLPEEKSIESFIWMRARRRAILEGKPFTHPIAYIGADSKGLDKLIAMPGDNDCDSHGTYPFPGIYKDIGPIGSTELISHHKFDDPLKDNPSNYELYYNAGSDTENDKTEYSNKGEIELIPDWERIIPFLLDKSEKNMRQNWGWLVLPIRWGFPASESPGAGILENADTGNQSPFGPVYNSGWNRVGPCSGYGIYEPHLFARFETLDLQDSFHNSLGFLNAFTIFLVIPPFDYLTYLTRLATWHIKGIQNPPTYMPILYPKETIPFRNISHNIGYDILWENRDFARLLLIGNNKAKINEEAKTLPGDFHISDEINDGKLENFGAFSMEFPYPIVVSTSFHIGRKFVSENLIRIHNSKVRYELSPEKHDSDNSAFELQKVFIEGNLSLREYSGSLRYNLLTGRFQPFIKAGYGYSRYKIGDTKIAINSRKIPVELPRSTSVSSPKWLPNTIHLGIGIEFIPWANYIRFCGPGLRLEYALYGHKLGNIEDKLDQYLIIRNHLNISLSLSF